ncbi:MAG: hypothetical protein PF692_02025 [Kiritimatiellae bacterium]|jgi:hypothetical protein|nr:hypothetical protein [Kiritimatiellia bacterium]
MKAVLKVLIGMLFIYNATAEGFYLRLDTTGKDYGPFDSTAGSKFVLGKATFTVVKKTEETAEIEGEKFTYTCQPITPLEILKPFDKDLIDQKTPRSTFRSLITAMKNKNWENFNKTYWKREDIYKQLGISAPKKETYIKAWDSVEIPKYELHYLICYKEYKILIIEYSSNEYKAGRVRETYPMKKIDNKFYIMNQFSYDYSTFNEVLSDLDFNIAEAKYKNISNK